MDICLSYLIFVLQQITKIFRDSFLMARKNYKSKHSFFYFRLRRSLARKRRESRIPTNNPSLSAACRSSCLKHHVSLTKKKIIMRMQHHVKLWPLFFNNSLEFCLKQVEKILIRKCDLSYKNCPWWISQSYLISSENEMLYWIWRHVGKNSED